MKIKVTLQIELEFETSAIIELPSQDPINHDEEMSDLLEQGKRCFFTGRARSGYNSNPVPVTDLKVDDELFWINGDAWEEYIGKITKIETIE